MSRFSKFQGGGSQLPATTGKFVPAITSGESGNPLVDAAKRAASGIPPHAPPLHSKSANFAIALDGTASMTNLIEDAKASLSQIIKRITREAGRPVQIQLFVYRDYDVQPKILEQSPLTADADKLVAWLKNISADGGGGNDGEAIEVALSEIQKIGGFSAVVLAGDEPPNNRKFLDERGLQQSSTAQTIASRYGVAKVPIHTFVVGHDPRTIQEFASLSKSSGGKSGRLDGSAAMIDMAVLAMLAQLKGEAAVREYVAANTLTQSAQNFAALLLSGPSK